MQPAIKIKYAKFLDPVFITYSKQLFPEWKPISIEETKHIVAGYQNIWKREGQSVLNAIRKNTDLNYKQNIINVYVVRGNPRQFSDPIVMKVNFELQSDFIDVLTHELIHKILSDNKNLPDYRLALKEMFPDETDTTYNHIFLHAIHKDIYLNTLNDKNRLDKNIKRSASHDTEDYMRAWQIVEEIGYKKIINICKEELVNI